MRINVSNSPGWKLLRSSQFIYFWLGQIVSQVGDSLNKIALLWFIYQLTGSAFDMTLIGVLQSLPPLLMSPFMGVYIDRLPKKSLLISIDLTRTVLVTLIPLLYFFGVLTLPWIYVLVFVNAIVSAVFGPAMAAAIPLMVKPSELTAANSLIHSAATTGVLVGPVLGGMLSAFMGAQNVLYLDAGTFAFSVFCISLLKLWENKEDIKSCLTDSVNEELKESLHFVFKHRPTIKGLMVTSALFSGGFAAFPFLLPIFAKVYLGVGSVWLGWLWSSFGAGMVTMTLVLAGIRQRSQRDRFFIMSAGTGVAALSAIGLTFVHGPWMAMWVVGFVGAGTAIFTPLMWSVLQERTPESLRGRVFTLVGATDMASATLVMACMGSIAEWFGPIDSLRSVSLLFLVTAMIIWWVRRHKLHRAGVDVRARETSSHVA